MLSLLSIKVLFHRGPQGTLIHLNTPLGWQAALSLVEVGKRIQVDLSQPGLCTNARR